MPGRAYVKVNSNGFAGNVVRSTLISKSRNNSSSAN
jgi:hypothetical protein